MQRLLCPSCGTATTESALLPHPPGNANASRALAKKYCPNCGTELRLAQRLHWWHPILIGAPFAVVYLKPRFALLGWPAWSYGATLVILFCVLIWSVRRARRLEQPQ